MLQVGQYDWFLEQIGRQLPHPTAPDSKDLCTYSPRGLGFTVYYLLKNPQKYIMISPVLPSSGVMFHLHFLTCSFYIPWKDGGKGEAFRLSQALRV